MGWGSKKRKSFYFNNANSKRHKTGAHRLQPGKIGFLCTSSGSEKACVHEAYDILNEAANKIYGEDKTDLSQADSDPSHNESGEDQTLEASLEAELKSLKSDRIKRFSQLSTKTRNCIFISTTLDDPLKICVKVMDDIHITQESKTNRLVRMTPVHVTCKAIVNNIEKSLKELIIEKFPKESTTYYFVIKVRNNTSISENNILAILNSIFHKLEHKHSVDSIKPTFVIKVDILQTMCCIGVLTDFFSKYCGYNLTKIAGEQETTSANISLSAVDNIEKTRVEEENR